MKTTFTSCLIIESEKWKTTIKEHVVEITVCIMLTSKWVLSHATVCHTVNNCVSK